MKRLLLPIAIISAFITGCKSNQKNAPVSDVVNVAPEHSSRNSLDWEGYYRGVVPCSDCSGIKTELQLQKDQTFTLRQLHLGRDEKVISGQGKFRWDANGSKVYLSAISIDSTIRGYQVAENKLFQLDKKGDRILGELARYYVLHKNENEIENRYWKLIELQGQPVPVDPNKEKQPHFRLDKERGYIIGFGGCNAFNGSYDINQGNRINFSKIVSTKMACMDVNYESNFLSVFSNADLYAILNDTLHLRQTDVEPTLAKFTLSYFKDS